MSFISPYYRSKRLTLIGLKDYRAIVKNLTQIEASGLFQFLKFIEISHLVCKGVTFMFKVVNNLAPLRISSMFQNSNHIHSYNLRGSNSSLFLPRPNTEYGRKCFRYSGVKIWNSISEQVRNSESLNSFNRNISSVSLTN